MENQSSPENQTFSFRALLLACAAIAVLIGASLAADEGGPGSSEPSTTAAPRHAAAVPAAGRPALDRSATDWPATDRDGPPAPGVQPAFDGEEPPQDGSGS